MQPLEDGAMFKNTHATLQLIAYGATPIDEKEEYPRIVQTYPLANAYNLLAHVLITFYFSNT